MRRFMAAAGLVLATLTSTMAQFIDYTDAIAAAIAQPNKTAKIKTSDPLKNFNCLYCKKQAKMVASCFAKTSNYNITTAAECSQLANDLAKWCNGEVVFTKIPDNTGSEYAVVKTTFPCHEGPVVAYAKKADYVYARNVKYLTCKTCNSALKAWEKCIVGKTVTGTTVADQVNSYASILDSCAAEVGTLVQSKALCRPAIFSQTPKFLPDMNSNGEIVGVEASVLLADLHCVTVMGTYLKSTYNLRTVTYAARYAGMGSLAHYYFA